MLVSREPHVWLSFLRLSAVLQVLARDSESSERMRFSWRGLRPRPPSSTLPYRSSFDSEHNVFPSTWFSKIASAADFRLHRSKSPATSWTDLQARGFVVSYGQRETRRCWRAHVLYKHGPHHSWMPSIRGISRSILSSICAGWHSCGQSPACPAAGLALTTPVCRVSFSSRRQAKAAGKNHLTCEFRQARLTAVGETQESRE